MKRAAIAALLSCAACAEAVADSPDAAPAIDAPAIPDARLLDAAPPDAAPEPPPRYPTERTHSPINGAVQANLIAISLRPGGSAHRDDVFAKVGDSITVATQFLSCFAEDDQVDLGAFGDLAGTRDHFKLGDAAGKTPYDRTSLAAGVGWSADWVLAGTPSPLDQEIGLIMPRYAIVMYGSNDAAARSPFQFGANLLEIVDQLSAQGIIPLLSTVPPNDQNADVGAKVPRENAIVRGIAQGRLVPLMDYWKEMNVLPGHGLSGDHLHPNVFSGGGCKLTVEGLMFGYNVRNRLALEALDRARSIVEGDPAPDVGVPAATIGAGSYAEPLVIGSFPYSDLRDTSSSSNTISTYTGCGAVQDESGPEYVYRLTLQSTATVRAMVIVRAGVDIDVHLLSGGLTADKCVQRDDKEIVATLAPGTHYFVLDSYAPSGLPPKPGEYQFVLVAE